jgi:FecR protein
MKGRILCNLILFVLLLNISPISQAAIGTIIEQQAAVPSIQRLKNTLPGTKGTGVEMADEIKTSAGKVGIKFQDNTQVQVNENSKLVIDEFVYDPKNKDAGKLALNMASGTVRYASGAIAHNNPSKVAINTPTATIAVRGTDFSATVDELGRSTIILLPSCREGFKNVNRDCKVGIIDVITDAGTVTLDQAFQATQVNSRSESPTKPVTLKLTEDAISNILILAPPAQLTAAQETTKVKAGGFNALDQDFLKESQLVNALDAQQKAMYQDKLSRNPLDADMLPNLLDIITAQIGAANSNLLKMPSANSVLPDYKASTGVVAEVDSLAVNLSRDDGSNIQSVHVDRSRALTIYQIQGSVEVKNRVNNAGTTTIILKQN